MPKPNSVFLLANLQHLQVASNFLKNHKSVDQVSFFMGYILIWSSRWHPTPVLLPGKSHGRRSLVGCSPWDRKDSDTTERLHFQFSLFTFIHWRRKWQTHSSVLVWRIPGTGEPGGLPSMGSLVGCRLWGRTEWDTTEAIQQQQQQQRAQVIEPCALKLETFEFQCC